MTMRKNLLISIWFTLATTILFGLIYPLTVTGLAQLLSPHQANGQLIKLDGEIVGSKIIGQFFAGPGYFYSRPSAAGYGYDAADSGGSTLGPTNRALIDRVNQDAKRLEAQNPGIPVPVDLVTASGSGLDPDISPAAADFQIPRVARQRHMSEAALRAMVAHHTQGLQLGFLGAPRVNVLELNLDLDATHPMPRGITAP